MLILYALKLQNYTEIITRHHAFPTKRHFWNSAYYDISRRWRPLRAILSGAREKARIKGRQNRQGGNVKVEKRAALMRASKTSKVTRLTRPSVRTALGTRDELVTQCIKKWTMLRSARKRDSRQQCIALTSMHDLSHAYLSARARARGDNQRHYQREISFCTKRMHHVRSRAAGKGTLLSNIIFHNLISA